MAMVHRPVPKKPSSNLDDEAPQPSYTWSSSSLDLEVSRSDGSLLYSENFKCFSSRETRVATENFQSSNVLGKEEYGTVFKGLIQNKSLTDSEPGTNIVVAVKRLPLGWGCEPSLELEAVKQLSRLCHPNLVKILGYCSDVINSTIVYEYVPQGSLKDYLLGGTSPLQYFEIRIKIALGAAKGLAFLHNNMAIHGLFKPSNILLGLNYSAKLSEFGFAQINPGLFFGGGIETIYGVFKIGLQFINEYTDPIGVRTGFTAKSDVYRFGVVLLEMLWNGQIGKDPLRGPYGTTENRFRDFDKYLDSLNSSTAYNSYGLKEGEICIAAGLALRCISKDINWRPTMDEVVTILESIWPYDT